ncbi:SAM-dependent methyltransferase [Bernardetia sp.]|uniref:SAM-dependent methyltransferase n=1 Tax=Bernardetia sp. TaxID=1937974 RepID=UPI0025BCB308|nr:class I SAM-dependent methyltransferase [Bernardetia sp.]
MSNYNSDKNNSSNEWFKTWFDSHYYHILYKDRDDTEARMFIDNISLYLNFLPNDKILDLACGKGRHSIYLNQKGLSVEGIDLSEESIQYAKQFENERLKFTQHDMREVYKSNHFDFILNFFTSFGYFPTDKENQQAITAMAKGLQNEGRIVLDFFNTKKVIETLVEYEEKVIAGITFKISKSIENGFIVKDIKFKDQGKNFHFQERVKAIPANDFLRYFRDAGLTVARIFGDYDLSEFEEDISERMIFVVEK